MTDSTGAGLTKEAEALVAELRDTWSPDDTQQERAADLIEALQHGHDYWKSCYQEHFDRAEAALASQAARVEADARRIAELEAELDAISGAIGTVRFMDPPDGGDVPLAEQVRRMKAALDAAEDVLQPFAKAGELFGPDTEGLYEQSIYAPAAGPEYSIGANDLRRARALLNADASEVTK